MVIKCPGNLDGWSCIMKVQIKSACSFQHKSFHKSQEVSQLLKGGEFAKQLQGSQKSPPPPISDLQQMAAESHIMSVFTAAEMG